MPKRAAPVGCTVFACFAELGTDVKFVKAGAVIAQQFCPDVNIQQLGQLERAAQASKVFREYQLMQGRDGNIIISVDVPAVRRGESIKVACKVLSRMINDHLGLRCTIQYLMRQWHVVQILGGRTEHTPQETEK